MNKREANQMLEKAMKEFAESYDRLLVTIDTYETETKSSINNLQNFVDKFPFAVSFDEIPIQPWVDSVVASLKQSIFKVLDYQYLNTGGNTMVGIHRVWLPEEKKVVYVYTNEEGSTISTVDYIRDELDIDDYDEFMMDVVDWGRITGYEKYFELYRYCFNQYLVDDCKHFGTMYDVQPHLLSDELQEMISADYLKYLEIDHNGLVSTDGKIIIIDPDYEAPEADATLQSVKDFRRWHGSIAANEEYYDKWYTLEFAGKKVKLPFIADVWDAVGNLLDTTIEEW